MVSACVFTMAHNERVNLPIWAGHHGRQVGAENLYVLDHGSTDGSTANLGPVQVVPVERTEFDEYSRTQLINDFQHDLLKRYDIVIYTDCDELVAPDPMRYANLRAYLGRLTRPVTSTVGLNLVHIPNREPRIDLSRPILSQRHYASFSSYYCKPLLVREPVQWSIGFHACDKETVVDPDLYLFHLKSMDQSLAVERLHYTRQMEWAASNLSHNIGSHQRATDDEFVRAHFGGKAHAVETGRVEPFDCKPLIKDMLGAMTTDGQGFRRNGVCNGPVMEIPSHFTRIF